MPVFPEQITEKRGRGRPRKTDPDYKPHPGGKTYMKHSLKSDLDQRHYCLSCPSSYKHYSVLKLHQKKHTKLFTNPWLLKSYKQLKLAEQFYVSQSYIEPGQKVVTCKTCNGEFRFLSLWLRHYMIKHEKYLKCSKCSRKCHSAMELRRHRVMKHRDGVVTKLRVLKRFKIYRQRVQKYERLQSKESPKKYRKKYKGKKGNEIIFHYEFLIEMRNKS